MIARRAMLAGGAALTALAAASGGAAGGGRFFGPNRPLGLQLYMVSGDLERAFDATLARIAALGYHQVELVSTIARSAREIRASLDRAGLACTSGHYPAERLGDLPGRTLADDLGPLIDDAHAIGMGYLIMSLFPLPDRLADPGSRDVRALYERAAHLMKADDWRRIADRLNGQGERIARAGLRLGYHNHTAELAPMDGPDGLDILLRHTDPALVSFEMDVAWVVAGGGSPEALLRRHAGRFRLLHVKDLARVVPGRSAASAGTVPVGDGTIDWQRLLPLAAAAGVRDYFVEQEPPYAEGPLAAAGRSFRYLSRLGERG